MCHYLFHVTETDGRVRVLFNSAEQVVARSHTCAIAKNIEWRINIFWKIVYEKNPARRSRHHRTCHTGGEQLAHSPAGTAWRATAIDNVAFYKNA